LVEKQTALMLQAYLLADFATTSQQPKAFTENKKQSALQTVGCCCAKRF
jgi:hypothetical protein